MQKKCANHFENIIAQTTLFRRPKIIVHDRNYVLYFKEGNACLTVEPPLQAVLRGGGGPTRCCAGPGPECTLCAKPGAARQEVISHKVLMTGF